ncbi:MAG: hypothetical protein GXX96_37695 [Planctomycetaceae bacterium]|nr:hypothetical protein [Planctomycetaceae bacterium]
MNAKQYSRRYANSTEAILLDQQGAAASTEMLGTLAVGILILAASLKVILPGGGVLDPLRNNLWKLIRGEPINGSVDLDGGSLASNSGEGGDWADPDAGSVGAGTGGSPSEPGTSASESSISDSDDPGPGPACTATLDEGVPEGQPMWQESTLTPLTDEMGQPRFYDVMVNGIKRQVPILGGEWNGTTGKNGQYTRDDPGTERIVIKNGINGWRREMKIAHEAKHAEQDLTGRGAHLNQVEAEIEAYKAELAKGMEILSGWGGTFSWEGLTGQRDSLICELKDLKRHIRIFEEAQKLIACGRIREARDLAEKCKTLCPYLEDAIKQIAN